MKVVSQSVGCLRKIDFVDALLRSKGVVAQNSATFEEPGVLGVACVSYEGPVSTSKPPGQAYHGIGYRICGAQTIRVDKPQSFSGRTGRPGMTAIVPASEGSEWLSVGPHEMVHFYLSSGLVRELAAEVYGVDGSKVEIQEAGFHLDENIARYAMAFRERLLEPDPPWELELNAMANLLGVHLLRHYSNFARRPEARVDQKLSAGQLRSVIDFMLAHLDSALKLSDLADVVAMNQYRFARAFQATTGDSPHRHLTKLRIAHAQDLLVSSKLSLSAIAAMVGFSSQSHMTLAFQRTLSITPGRYRSGTGNMSRDEAPTARSYVRSS
jgi:AraC family transcriptional regulator